MFDIVYKAVLIDVDRLSNVDRFAAQIIPSFRERGIVDCRSVDTSHEEHEQFSAV